MQEEADGGLGQERRVLGRDEGLFLDHGSETKTTGIAQRPEAVRTSTPLGGLKASAHPAVDLLGRFQPCNPLLSRLCDM